MFMTTCLVDICVHNSSTHMTSLVYECRHQNENSSSFIKGLIECNLPAIGVAFTHCICPSRYGSTSNLGFRLTLSVLHGYEEVSCVRSLAGRLQCLCVIACYELLGSGLGTLEQCVGSDPSRPKHSISSLGWEGEGKRGGRGEWSEIFLTSSKSRKENKMTALVNTENTHKHALNDHSSLILWPRALSLILRLKKNKQTNYRANYAFLHTLTNAAAHSYWHLLLVLSWLSKLDSV